MTATRNLTAATVLAGLLAAAVSSTAAGEGPPSSPADAITQCLVQHGFPPLPPGTVLTPPGGGAPGSPAAPAVPLPGVAPAAGTTVATLPAPVSVPAGTVPAVTIPAGGIPAASGTTIDAGSLPVGGSATLPCPGITINNNVYYLTVTTTSTTVAAPINAAAGSITLGADAPPVATAGPTTAAAGRAAIGRPIKASGTDRTGHRRAVRAKRAVRVRLVSKRSSR